MTAPRTLPPEVERIVAALTACPSTLAHHRNEAISVAFRYGLIEVTGSAPDRRTLQWRTVYGLRGGS
jgi:hypothetical protein